MAIHDDVKAAKKRAGLWLDLEEISRFVCDQHPEQCRGPVTHFTRDQAIRLKYRGKKRPSKVAANRAFERWKVDVRPLGVFLSVDPDVVFYTGLRPKDLYAIDSRVVAAAVPVALQRAEELDAAYSKVRKKRSRRKGPVVWLTSKQAAEQHGVSPITIQSWPRQGAPHKRGPRNVFLFDAEKLGEWVERRKQRGRSSFARPREISRAPGGGARLREIREFLSLPWRRMAEMLGVEGSTLLGYMYKTGGVDPPRGLVEKAEGLLDTHLAIPFKGRAQGITREQVEHELGKSHGAAAAARLGIGRETLKELARIYGIPWPTRYTIPLRSGKVGVAEGRARLKAAAKELNATAAALAKIMGVSAAKATWYISGKGCKFVPLAAIEKAETAAREAREGHRVFYVKGRAEPITEAQVMEAWEASGRTVKRAIKILGIGHGTWKRINKALGLYRRNPPRFLVRSPSQGLKTIEHPEITANWKRSLKWKPRHKKAVLLPCAGTKPFPEAPSHAHGYLPALEGKKVDLFVVSEPLGVVPYDWSRRFPQAHYDFPPRFLQGEGRTLLVHRIADWLCKVGTKYKKIYLALPAHHRSLVTEAMASMHSVPGGWIVDDVGLGACLASGACPPGHVRPTTESYRKFLREQVNPPAMRFSNWHMGGHHGQDDFRLFALKPGEIEPTDENVLGYLDYSLYEGNVHVNMIAVPDQLQRQGIGTALWGEVQRLWPDAKFPRGFMTKAGRALRESVGPRENPLPHWIPRAAGWLATGALFEEVLSPAVRAGRAGLRHMIANPFLGGDDYPWLTLAEVDRWVPLMRELGVSKVAREGGSKQTGEGFLQAYRACGGDPGCMATRMATRKSTWARRRGGFIARHMAQVENRGEALWRKRKGSWEPTRRHLGLIAWAFSPMPHPPGENPPTVAQKVIEKAVRPCTTPAEVKKAATSIKRSLRNVAKHSTLSDYHKGQILGLLDRALAAETPMQRFTLIRRAEDSLDRIRKAGKRATKGYKPKRKRAVKKLPLGHLFGPEHSLAANPWEQWP